MNNLTTKNGKTVMPIGLGTFPFQGQQMADIVKTVADIGYSIIDTADDYRGETGIGMALSQGLVKRENLFLQTKISNDTAFDDEPLAGKFFNRYSLVMKRHSVDEIVREKVSISLREMKTDYIDSLLIHYPYPGFFEKIWESMIKLQQEGIVRYIGVSNFHINHCEKLKYIGKLPDINEVYISPLGTKEELLNYSKDNNIQLMSYSPLMDIRIGKVSEALFSDIMKKYNKTLSQIILRWNIDRGCIPLPKSSHPSRLKENFSVFDFELSEDEIRFISSFNKNIQILPETKICPGL